MCDGGWNRSNDTEVVCRQLSFGSAENSTNDTRDEAYYHEGGNGIFWFESFSCNGSEPALEQCLYDEWESTQEQDAGVKCASNNDFIPNKTQQFSCNIDFRSSRDLEEIMDGEKKLPAASDLKSMRIVLSDHHNNATIIINNINNAEGAPTWLIVTAITGAIGTFITFIMCLCKALHKIPDEWTKIKPCLRRSGSYIVAKFNTKEKKTPSPDEDSDNREDPEGDVGTKLSDEGEQSEAAGSASGGSSEQ